MVHQKVAERKNNSLHKHKDTHCENANAWIPYANISLIKSSKLWLAVVNNLSSGTDNDRWVLDKKCGHETRSHTSVDFRLCVAYHIFTMTDNKKKLAYRTREIGV